MCTHLTNKAGIHYTKVPNVDPSASKLHHQYLHSHFHNGCVLGTRRESDLFLMLVLTSEACAVWLIVLLLASAWRVHIFLWDEAGTIWRHHSHMECPLPTCSEVITAAVSLRKRCKTQILQLLSLSLSLFGLCSWEVGSLWEMCCVEPQTAPGLMILLQITELSWGATLTGNNKSKRKVSEGECKWGFVLREEGSLFIGCVEECQPDHTQRFIYCQLPRHWQTAGRLLIL